MRRCKVCKRDLPIERFRRCFTCNECAADARREDPLGRHVDPAPVIAAIARSQDDATSIALRLGWMEHGRADAARVRRVLERDTITLRNAARILDAIGVMPVEVGL